jgi:hypothetical protein
MLSYSLKKLLRNGRSREESLPGHSYVIVRLCSFPSLRFFQSISRVVELLTEHGTTDLTNALDLSACTQHPISGGGFGDIYAGVLENGERVAIKCARVNFGDSEGYKMIKASLLNPYVCYY